MDREFDTLGTARTSSKTTTYVVVACIAVLLFLTLLGSIMNVGDHLFGVHPLLGWVFWGLIILLMVIGVALPVIQIARRPIFSLYELHDVSGHAKKRYCQMLANNLVANAAITDEEVKQIQAAIDQGDNADDLLIDFFNERITPGIDEETKRNATSAFFVAAISRSPLISTVTMLSLCLDLVRSIVERCGFRPTNAGLARLYARVMLSALIVGGIEDADLSDMLSQALGGGAGAHVGGLLFGAAAEGLVSAFLVFRVGIITKRWLTSEDGPARMRQLRRTSYREALALMRDSGFAVDVTDKLRKVTGTAATTAATAVANAATSTATNAVSTVANVVGEVTYPTANAAEAAGHGAVETAREVADRVRGLFHR